MVTAAVAQVKAHLSAFLKRIKAGEEVLITERGIPIAKLVPLGNVDRRSPRKDRLVRAGLLKPGTGRMALLYRTPRGPREAGRSVLDALLEERSKGR
jgi:prevent-host-death family protein